jgi:hypothetical protein
MSGLQTFASFGPQIALYPEVPRSQGKIYRNLLASFVEILIQFLCTEINLS